MIRGRWAILLIPVLCGSSPYVPNKGYSWLHIEKTSSWIGDFLLTWACPTLIPMFESYNTGHQAHYFYDEFNQNHLLANQSVMEKCRVKIIVTDDQWSYGFHQPYKPAQSNGSVVTLLRDPIDRLISAALFNDGWMFPPGQPCYYRPAKSKIEKHRISISPIPILAYAYTEGIPSCQTKMVLGHNCGSVYEPSAMDIAEAKRRIESDFMFIGLTDEALATAELFHAMYGQRQLEGDEGEQHQEPFFAPVHRNVRKGRYHRKKKDVVMKRHLKEHNWTDPADMSLYLHAQRLFYSRCIEYNITTTRFNVASNISLVDFGMHSS